MLAAWEERLRDELHRRDLDAYFIIDHVPNGAALAEKEAEIASHRGRFALIAWRNAERNLDLPAVALFRLLYGARLIEFGRLGGIEGVLQRTGCRAETRTAVLGGAATLAVCSPSEHDI